MKRIKRVVIIISIIVLLAPIIVRGKEYTNHERNFKLETPDTYYVIDEMNIEENIAFIEYYGMFPEEIRNIFRGSDEVTLGLRSDELVTMHIRISRDNESRRIWNILNSSNRELERFQDLIKGRLTSSDSEVTYQEYTENRYIKTIIEYEDHYEIDYQTILNGNYYEILFESYDIEERDNTVEEIEEIFETFTITKVEGRPITSPPDWVKVVLITVSVIGIIGVITEIIQYKRKK